MNASAFTLSRMNGSVRRELQTMRSGLPVVRLNLIQPFVAELERRDIDPASTLAKFDLSRELVANRDVFVPARVVYGIIEGFARVADEPHLGVGLGEALDISTWSPFAEAARIANNTAELLLACAVNASRDASSASLTLETSGGRTRFHVRRLASTNVQPAQVDAFWIGILIAILRKVTGSNWDPSEILASVCDTRALPDQYHGIRIAEGGVEGPSVAFPSSWLFLPFHRPAGGTHDVNEPSAIAARSFVETVRQTLRPHVAEHDLGVARAADLCGLSKRTLQKRLQREGRTLSGVIAELRRDRAIGDLDSTDRAVSDIAARVGYADATVFSRAFKRWTGVSPQQYRKQHAR